ncbi:MAG: polyprenyl synthetase family protein [Verrucomicrobiota bacterium]|nr:polyprenyl synthetase family protein [Verrucomicrobiota bacterium]
MELHLEALRTFLNGQVEEFEEEIREHVAYCLKHSGKRIRPMLLFYGGWKGEGIINPAHVKAAAVVELVHLATLVHDDILDDAHIRHKSPTLSRLAGPEVAVLVGDALFAHALNLAADFPTTEVCKTVALATRRVCAGEIAQNFQKGNTELSRALYYRIIDYKTAELFRVSSLLGALLADYPAAFVEAAGGFGRHLGIAYQIFDDLTDILGKEENAGKTLGTDAANCKLTLPLMLLAEKFDAPERAAFVQSLRDGQVSGESLRERFEKEHIAEAVAAAFDHEIFLANRCLEPYGALPPVHRLLEISHFVAQMVNHLKH